MQKTVECFYPGSSFPAISTTGRSCSLQCKHCAGKYLEGMIPATSPEDLLSVAEALAERGAKGFLLSGGVDPAGKVRLSEFTQAIETVKSTTDLRINAHMGLTPDDEVERLVSSGIDAFSIDVYGSNETIRDVLGLRAKVEDYMGVLESLERHRAPIVAPHICIGIDGGRVKGELEAVGRLVPFDPKVLVLISLIPTKGTAFSDVRPPSASDVTRVIGAARDSMPRTRIQLGCMRSKLDRTSEMSYIKAGLDGIVLPAAVTVEELKGQGVLVRKRSTCCALV